MTSRRVKRKIGCPDRLEIRGTATARCPPPSSSSSSSVLLLPPPQVGGIFARETPRGYLEKDAAAIQPLVSVLSDSVPL